MNEIASWIAYVGPVAFPWGQPASRRMCGIARSLADAGYRVVVGSGDAFPLFEEALNEGEPEGTVCYLGLGESPDRTASLFEKAVRVFWRWGANTAAWLESQETKPAFVFVYGGGSPYMLRLLPWCRRHGVPLVADVVEWYDPRQMKGGTFGPFNVSAKLALRYLYPKCNGVVAVSQFLSDYYAGKGNRVIRVPPTLDVAGIDLNSRLLERRASGLTLIYAGTPGRKDLLGTVIQAVSNISCRGMQIELVVIGPELAEVKALCRIEHLPSCVDVLGPREQTEVGAYIRSADFSVFLREPLRFANAGFPTKFVESMANGTPVITNSTSDLGLYLDDGIEGLVCLDHTVEALTTTLERAVTLSPEQLMTMRKAARRQAELSFDYRRYSQDLAEFLQGL